MSLIKSMSELTKPTGQIVRYAFLGPYPPITATVGAAEAFRSAALSALHATSGSKASFLFSGHHDDGAVSTEHRHAYYLPRPDKNNQIRELLVVSPWGRFSQEELTALQTVRAIQWNGPSTKTSLELLDIDDSSTIRLACHWVSLTPYVPMRRFWGMHGKRHLTPDKQISSEIVQIIPETIIENIELKQWTNIRVRIAPHSRTKLPDTPLCRIAYFVEFKCKEPLCAPVALGHSSHFGLGQFIALEE